MKLWTKSRKLRKYIRADRRRKIGLYGGSFNPAHEGHLHIAREAIKRLDLDEVWLLVSPGNPHKSRSSQAPYKKRFESARLLALKDSQIIANDIECHLGTYKSADTIHALKALMPKTQFFWIMGADHFAGFHTWYNWSQIVHALPIAIFDRPGYSVRGFFGKFATKYRPFRVSPQKLQRCQEPAWSFIRMRRHGGSATNIRAEMGHNWTKDV